MASDADTPEKKPKPLTYLIPVWIQWRQTTVVLKFSELTLLPRQLAYCYQLYLYNYS